MTPNGKNKYWKVHKNNIINYFDEEVNIYIRESWIKEIRNNYIYVGTYMNMGSWSYGYMVFNKRSIDYFKRENYSYEGEFRPLQQQRKEKLKKLYENR